VTIQVEYHCNVCRDEIDPKAPEDPRNQYRNGWPFKFDSGELKEAPRWQDAPVHICWKCANSIAAFIKGRKDS
jgi:hypothetical protein